MDLVDKYLRKNLKENAWDDFLESNYSYKSLNDASIHDKGLSKGQTEIWYMNKKSFGNFITGPKFIEKYGGKKGIPNMPTPKTISKTHVLLGKIKETDKSKIFRIMQGEFWSPQGEARNLISSKGLAHTSMSVGDIIKTNGKYYMVDNFGFYPIV